MKEEYIHKPGNGNRSKIVIGEGISKRPLSIDLPFLLPYSHFKLEDRETILGMTLGQALSGMPVTLTSEGKNEEIRKIFDAYKPKKMVRWTPLRENVDLPSIKKADLVGLAMEEEGISKEFKVDQRLHPEIRWGKDLLGMVRMLREVVDCPILVHINASDVSRDIDYVLVSEVDGVIIDFPNPFSFSSGSLTCSLGNQDLAGTIVEAVNHFRTFMAGENGVKLIVNGPFFDPADILKALCMGADIVGLDHAVAMLVNLILTSHGGGDDIKGPSWDVIGESIQNMVGSYKVDINDLMRILGLTDWQGLNRNMLVAKTYDSASVTGLPLKGFGRPLPMWKH